MRPSALILSGSGRYADPWHPFPETSGALAEILDEAGFVTRIDDDVDAAMCQLADVDLLVVNAGDPWRNDDAGESGVSPPAGSVDGLASALGRGMGVLAVHAAVASLRDYPEWGDAIGRIWLPSVSMHPPVDETRVLGGRFPDGSAIDDFAVFDERYCRLQPIGRSHVVTRHEGAGADVPREPSAWVREYGRARIAVDALGHDARSYESSPHRDLVRRLAQWATS